MQQIENYQNILISIFECYAIVANNSKKQLPSYEPTNLSKNDSNTGALL